MIIKESFTSKKSYVKLDVTMNLLMFIVIRIFTMVKLSTVSRLNLYYELRARAIIMFNKLKHFFIK